MNEVDLLVYSYFIKVNLLNEPPPSSPRGSVKPTNKNSGGSHVWKPAAIWPSQQKPGGAPSTSSFRKGPPFAEHPKMLAAPPSVLENSARRWQKFRCEVEIICGRNVALGKSCSARVWGHSLSRAPCRLAWPGPLGTLGHPQHPCTSPGCPMAVKPRGGGNGSNRASGVCKENSPSRPKVCQTRAADCHGNASLPPRCNTSDVPAAVSPSPLLPSQNRDSPGGGKPKANAKEQGAGLITFAVISPVLWAHRFPCNTQPELGVQGCFGRALFYREGEERIT